MVPQPRVGEAIAHKGHEQAEEEPGLIGGDHVRVPGEAACESKGGAEGGGAKGVEGCGATQPGRAGVGRGVLRGAGLEFQVQRGR